MTPSFDLSGRTALVTGANTGLGQAIALGLAAAGADIVAVGRSAPTETAEKVAALGRALHAIPADLSTTAPIADVVAKARDAVGDIDILVNNAGIIRRADSLDFSEEDWDAVIDTNLKTAFFLSQAVARTWVGAGRGGKILNICSMLSFQGGIRVPSYTASKSGLAGLTRLLACEWAAKGINVNGIAPGYFATNNTEALRADEGRNRDILARIPAGRWGDPSDLAGAAVFLASDASAYVHGTILTVDGGWMAR
ncbi:MULTISPECIES: 2-dehydro-3-deoxy-D-gluconate 5-dehydrogenase KduD [unclassified Brevundimonas]|mgnify:FL=1|jgi:2-deoxy-D-gluconate 3-dehydrogenase|uniref:2-dehydro-3-deoxy-D-gluconate 5-dehydrogenase KduD n=1 Tax=unclassified Brevundimonas TaxID=2622653 RepID=UPI000C409E8A|nr:MULTISPECIES: 2-dehydro-3-deoxy-D-gluconate 5-dehydrogenase KduD [unclassified Brevundimonas]MAL87874.1 2-deoxy-D-gluconate 3-dehydrogenase [Brevundimonas sp.]|tara:strand:+ start:38156 stop:38914 length:759 start_codon:yes stop_codon:yes gene_type:complete